MDSSLVNKAKSQADKHASKANNHPAVVFAARAGFVVSGILHILIGYIAIKVATGSGGGEASNTGALAEISSTPGGQVLLWFMVVGLAALSLWRFTTVFVDPDLKDKAKGGALGVVFASLALTTATFAMGGSKSDGDTATDVTAKALEFPGGKFLVIIAGLVVIGVGAYGIYKGATKKFKEDLEADAGSGNVGSAIEGAGMAGYIARGIAFVVLGGLIGWAAMSHDPDKASGLDAALRTIGEQPFGSALLVAMGIGFALYGVYCIARAKYTNEI